MYYLDLLYMIFPDKKLKMNKILYIVQLLEKIFLKNFLFEKGLEEQNYELICYALYFLLKYDFEISNVDPDEAISSNYACLNFLLSYIKKTR